MSILLNQDLAYQQSLYTDQLQDIKKSRADQRQQTENILRSKIPNPLERLLTPNQTRMFRLFRMVPNQLAESQKIQIQNIMDQLERWHSGGCYNLNIEQEK